MMTEPEASDRSLNGEANPKRKRRFKIFENKLKQSQPQLQPSIPQYEQQQAFIQPQKKQTRSSPVEIVKIPQKQDLQKQFYGGEEEEELQLLEVKLDEYCTVRSNRFGETNFLAICTAPSVMFKEDRLVVNEDSQLYQSIKEIKDSQSGLSLNFEDLRASVMGIDKICQESQSQTKDNYQRLRDLQGFLESVRAESSGYEKKLKEIGHRLENIEYVSGLQGKRRKSEQSVREKEELKVFIEQNGLRMEMEEDDEFAESHYLPAGLINQYLQERKAQKEQEAAQRAKQAAERAELSDIANRNIQLFHPIFKITPHQYSCLAKFILEELPARKEEGLVFHLLFRRGTTDLNIESVGERSDLEYKENLLFLIKTSTGKRIGGFISADLIEQQTIADSHAFLFTLQDNCHKFKVREESVEEAFTANRYYLITFSNDLMIASDCLQEESYCEWPTSYGGKDEHSNKNWFAGDFQFMIEHIQVYEILQAKGNEGEV